MAQSFPYKPNSCGSTKICPPKFLGNKFFNIILDSIEEIPIPYKADAVYYVRDGDYVAIWTVNEIGELVKSSKLTNIFTLENIAELKTIRGFEGCHAFLRGYYSDGDGGGGEFYWDQDSTATDNGGTIIAVYGTATGRWVRKVNTNTLNVRWFGAKGDKTVTNDTPAIQAAIDASKDYNGAILLPEGNYYLATYLKPYSGLKIEGDSYKGVQDASNLFYPRVSLTGANRTGYLIQPDTEDALYSDAWIANLYISGVTFQYCEYYIGNSDYTKYMSGVTLENCNFLASTRVALKGNYILSKIIDCDFGYYGDITYPTDMKHVEFVGSGALSSNSNSFIGSKFYNSTAQEAFLFQNGHSVTFNNCNIESNDNSTRCINMTSYNNISFISCWLEYNKGVVIVQGDTNSRLVSFISSTIVTGKTNQFIAATYNSVTASFSFTDCYIYSLGKFTDASAVVLTECRLTFDGTTIDAAIHKFSNTFINQDTFIWDGVTEMGTFVSNGPYPYLPIKDMYKGRRESYGTAAPTTGNWEQRDVVYNSNPTANTNIGWVCTVSGTPGIWKEFGRIEKFKKGTSVQSGTGVATTFTIAHSLGTTPTYINVQPGSANAKGISYITADATNITVNYDLAPLSGTNNLTFYWETTV